MYMHIVLSTLPLQTCSRILLAVADRHKFLDKLKRPTLSALARKAIAKEINEKCKKTTTCPHCAAVNGILRGVPL